MSNPQGPHPPAQPQVHGQPPPPQYAQGQPQYAQGQPQYAQGQPQYAQGQPQYAQPATVVYHPQQTTTIKFGTQQTQETCPNCHKQVMMVRDRSPSGIGWLVAMLVCLIGFTFILCLIIPVCIWILACSPLANFTYKCPLCGAVARTETRI